MADTQSLSELAKELQNQLPAQNLKSLNSAVCPDCKGTKTIRLGFDVRCGQSGYVCRDCAAAAIEKEEEPKVFHVPLVVLGRSDG